MKKITCFLSAFVFLLLFSCTSEEVAPRTQNNDTSKALVGNLR
jgi:outer membrane biogenesis lipoprotein LolB